MNSATENTKSIWPRIRLIEAITTDAEEGRIRNTLIAELGRLRPDAEVRTLLTPSSGNAAPLDVSVERSNSGVLLAVSQEEKPDQSPARMLLLIVGSIVLYVMMGPWFALIAVPAAVLAFKRSGRTPFTQAQLALALRNTKTLLESGVEVELDEQPERAAAAPSQAASRDSLWAPRAWLAELDGHGRADVERLEAEGRRTLGEQSERK